MSGEKFKIPDHGVIFPKGSERGDPLEQVSSDLMETEQFMLLSCMGML